MHHFRPTERAQVSRLSDLARRTQERAVAIWTDFLTPREAAIGYMMATRSSVAWCTWGGHLQAERVRGCFYPVGEEAPPSSAFAIDCVELAVRRGAEPPRHGDYLGALLGLGVTRDRFGDIIVGDSGAFVFCESRIVEVILRDFTQAGRTPVSVSLCGDVNRAIGIAPKTEERVVTLQSLRLDAFVGHAFSVSRTKALTPIRAGLVQLNFVPCDNPAEEVAVDDVISLRGEGRVRILSVEGTSRSGRTFVRFARYV